MQDRPTKWLYKIRNTFRERPSCFVSSDEPINFGELRKTFHENFCQKDCKEVDSPYARMASIRHSLWKQAKKLSLETDPLLDELCLVFADWVTKSVGGDLMFPDEMSNKFHEHASFSEYVFDLAGPLPLRK